MNPSGVQFSEVLRVLESLEEILSIVVELRGTEGAIPVLQSLLDQVQVNISKVPALSFMRLDIDSADTLLLAVREIRGIGRFN